MKREDLIQLSREELLKYIITLDYQGKDVKMEVLKILEDRAFMDGANCTTTSTFTSN